MLVHAEIAGEIAAGEFRQVDPIVQNRPQHPIGEAVVVFLVVLLRQVGDDVSGSRPLDRLGDDFVGWDHISAPAEPYVGNHFEDRRERNFEPAGAISSTGARNGHAIGNEDQPRQYRSSQLRDKRIAVRIRPAIE